MSYTFTYVDKGVINEYTITNNDATWQDLLQHFEYFLKGCNFSFKDGFVGFDAMYQQQQDGEDVVAPVEKKPVAKSAASQQMEFPF